MKRQLTRITAMILSLTIVLLSSTSAIAQTATDPNLESAISLGIGTSPSGIINLSPLSDIKDYATWTALLASLGIGGFNTATSTTTTEQQIDVICGLAVEISGGVDTQDYFNWYDDQSPPYQEQCPEPTWQP